MVSGSTIVHARLRLRLWLALWLLCLLLWLLLLLPAIGSVYDKDLVAALGIWHLRVLIIIGNLCDDVPRVEKSRNVSQHAEENIDDAIGRADTALDPYR